MVRPGDWMRGVCFVCMNLFDQLIQWLYLWGRKRIGRVGNGSFCGLWQSFVKGRFFVRRDL